MGRAVLLALLAGVGFAQQPASPTGKTMELTVVATGKDNAPVDDLEIADITIKDNGKKQTPLSFEKTGKGASNGPAVHNFVLLDRICCYAKDTPEHRAALLAILAELAKLPNVTMFSLRQELATVSDPSQGEKSVLARLANGYDPARPDASNWVFNEKSLALLPTKLDPQKQIQAWLKGLNMLTSTMQSRQGRKNFYWISSGSSLVAPTSVPTVEVGSFYDEWGESINIQSVDQRANSQGPQTGDVLRQAFVGDFSRTYLALRDSGAAIYPIFVGSSLAKNAQRRDVSPGMRDLAKATGGLSFSGPAETSLRSAVKDGQVCYLARYQVGDDMSDGKEHAIRVDTTRKDVKLRYRSVYSAPQKTK